MAQLELSRDEAETLASIIKSWRDGLRQTLTDKNDRAVANDIAARHLKKIDALAFNTRACAVCGIEFEATNPRKQTCSARCRQQLSRSKRDGIAIPARAEPVSQSKRDKSEQPEPKAPHVDLIHPEDWGELPASARRKQWLAMDCVLMPDLTRIATLDPGMEGWGRATITAIAKESWAMGRIGVLSDDNDAWPVIKYPHFHFLLNVVTGEVFTAGYPIPQLAIDFAVKEHITNRTPAAFAARIAELGAG